MNIFDSKNQNRLKSLDVLPDSCHKSAINLENHKEDYMKDGIFTADIIDQIICDLKSFNDENLRDEADKNSHIMEPLLSKYFYCG